MPMVVIIQRLPIPQRSRAMQSIWGGVQHQMKLVCMGRDPPQSPTQQSRQIHEAGVASQSGTLVSSIVGPGKNPGLIRHTRRVGTERDEIPADLDNPLVLPNLLVEDVAEYAALLSGEIVASSPKLIQHAPRHKRSCGQLRVRVFEFLCSPAAVILEHADVLEALVAFQILHPLRGQDQKAFDFRVPDAPKVPIVAWVLDQD